MLGAGTWGGLRYLQRRDTAGARASVTTQLMSVAVSSSQLAAAAPARKIFSSGTAALVKTNDSATARSEVREAAASRKTVGDSTRRTTSSSRPVALAGKGEVATFEVPDSGWLSAVATTWVNIRNHPRRDSTVVLVIGPGSRAQLAPSRSWWTKASVGRVTGWVDRRLFAIDSTKSR